VPVIGACIDAWRHGYRSPLWMYRYVRDQWWSLRKLKRSRIDVGPDEDIWVSIMESEGITFPQAVEKVARERRI
jgi:hypothetical protein